MNACASAAGCQAEAVDGGRPLLMHLLAGARARARVARVGARARALRAWVRARGARVGARARSARGLAGAQGRRRARARGRARTRALRGRSGWARRRRRHRMMRWLAERSVTSHSARCREREMDQIYLDPIPDIDQIWSAVGQSRPTLARNQSNWPRNNHDLPEFGATERFLQSQPNMTPTSATCTEVGPPATKSCPQT